MLLGLKGTGPSGFPSSMACAPEAKHHVDADGGVGNSCVKSRFSPPPGAICHIFRISWHGPTSPRLLCRRCRCGNSHSSCKIVFFGRIQQQLSSMQRPAFELWVSKIPWIEACEYCIWAFVRLVVAMARREGFQVLSFPCLEVELQLTEFFASPPSSLSLVYLRCRRVLGALAVGFSCRAPPPIVTGGSACLLLC